MTPTEYEAVVFDLDDTLVKTWEVKWRHHQAVAKRFYNFDLTEEALAEHWGKPFDEMIGYLYNRAAPLDEMRAANRSIEQEFLKEIQPDALVAIASLRRANKLLGVVTSTNQAFAEEDMKRLGFSLDDFVGIQGAEATEVHKPNPDVFAPILSKLATVGVHTPEKVVYVGDALMDFYAARDAGLGFIAITTGRISAEEFRQAGAEHIATSLSEASRLIGTTS